MFITTSKAANIINVSQPTIRSMVKRGLLNNYSTNKQLLLNKEEIIKFKSIYKKPLTYTTNKKKIWNYNFFNEQTPITAYWAGFILGDGNIHNNKLNISLSTTDKLHLETFCKNINLDSRYIKDQIGYNNSYVYKHMFSYLHLCHKPLTTQLLQWGIVPDKTHNFIEPNISIELLPHFFRGWIDADGTLDAKRLIIQLTGNTQRIEWGYNILQNKFGFNKNLHIYARKNGRCWCTLYINCNLTISKLFMLCNGIPRLERKWKPFEDQLINKHLI